MIIKKNDDRDLLSTDVIGSSVARSKRWLVAIVRICHEKKTGERLTKMGIENFLPIQQEVHQWSDRRKVVESVLLPMMVFVHADPKERKEVLSFSTVSRYMVMRGESSPTIIPDEQMARFRFMLDYSEEAICMNSAPLARQKEVDGKRRAFGFSDARFSLHTFVATHWCACRTRRQRRRLRQRRATYRKIDGIRFRKRVFVRFGHGYGIYDFADRSRRNVQSRRHRKRRKIRQSYPWSEP